jgi:hypothetical protein
MTRPYFAENTSQLDQIIKQADWLCQESGFPTVDDLYWEDPELFVTLNIEWRQNRESNQ